MNKKIYVLVLLALCLQSTVYSSEDLQQDLECGRQIMVNNAVNNFEYLTQSFNFLQTQGLINTTFHDFLEQNVSHDEHEDQDMDFDQVIIKAEDILIKNMKDKFLTTLETALQKRKDLSQFNDPVFLYVMQHKDTTMPDMVRLWLHEWSKTTNKEGWFPLHRAFLSNNNQIVKMLIDAGANLNIRNRYRETSLHRAIFYGNTEIVQILIDKGARLNLQDDFGKTPLYVAVSRDRTNIIKMLITAGANLGIRNKDNTTPLYFAVENNKTEIAQILIDGGAHVNLKNKYGRSLLHVAVLQNNIQMISLLITAGACINHQDDYGQTPLHIAVVNDNEEIAWMLIKAGARTTIQDVHGKRVDQLAGYAHILQWITKNRVKQQKKSQSHVARLINQKIKN